MGERLLCKQEVIGSIPFTSTNSEYGSRDGRVRRKIFFAERTQFDAGTGARSIPRDTPTNAEIAREKRQLTPFCAGKITIRHRRTIGRSKACVGAQCLDAWFFDK